MPSCILAPPEQAKRITGIVSLMQMAKTSAALKDVYKRQGMISKEQTCKEMIEEIMAQAGKLMHWN